MHSYPHTYIATASGASEGSLAITSRGLPTLQTAAPPEFDGPGGLWSPETLLCASLADCFVLTFRALSRAAHFAWLRLDCRVEGVLERVGQSSQFTRFRTVARLEVPGSSDVSKARALLERAEHGCLIANSLSGQRTLQAEVEVVGLAATG
jgi:organic hydroperoxide reductase OsmC/OhrA